MFKIDFYVFALFNLFGLIKTLKRLLSIYDQKHQKLEEDYLTIYSYIKF